VCVCVCVCLSLSVIKCNSNPLHLICVGVRGRLKNERRITTSKRGSAKVKVKFTLEKATKAQKGRKGIALLFL